jgi:hypothetical protein
LAGATGCTGVGCTGAAWTGAGLAGAGGWAATAAVAARYRQLAARLGPAAPVQARLTTKPSLLGCIGVEYLTIGHLWRKVSPLAQLPALGAFLLLRIRSPWWILRQ